jgi:RAD51-like protein 2
MGFTKSETIELYEALDMFKSLRMKSAYDMMKEAEAKAVSTVPCITTLSSGLDTVLGGGVYTGKLTEVCGAAGLGKTQLCMQLCVNVQIPRRFGGLGAKAVYVDTEGSFSSKRLVEIAGATIRAVQAKFGLDSRSGEIIVFLL